MPRREPGEPYARVDSNEASAMLEADPDGTVVIDVRRDDEWITGHVTGFAMRGSSFRTQVQFIER